MTLLLQVLTTISLILGVITGEFFSTKAFGNIKKSWVYIAEVAVFVTIIVLVLSNITITDYSGLGSIGIYFLLGCLTIIFVRGLFSGMGLFAEQIKKTVFKEKNETDYIIGLKRALERRKIKSDEIQKIAKEAGFNKKSIEKVFDWWQEVKEKKEK